MNDPRGGVEPTLQGFDHRLREKPSGTQERSECGPEGVRRVSAEYSPGETRSSVVSATSASKLRGRYFLSKKAGIAQSVERKLAKLEVASSNLVSRSIFFLASLSSFFCVKDQDIRRLPWLESILRRDWLA